MFIVYREACTVRYVVAVFETEEDAIDFCDMWDWGMVDENNFLWDLYYEER